MLKTPPLPKRWAFAVLCAPLTFGQAVPAQHPSPGSAPVALRDLVPRGDPPSAHDLRFGASFARQTIEYVRTHDAVLVTRMAESPAITRILSHARTFDYDVPKDSRTALVQHLLGPPSQEGERSAACQRCLAYFNGPMLTSPLPEKVRENETHRQMTSPSSGSRGEQCRPPAQVEVTTGPGWGAASERDRRDLALRILVTGVGAKCTTRA